MFPTHFFPVKIGNLSLIIKLDIVKGCLKISRVIILAFSKYHSSAFSELISREINLLNFRLDPTGFHLQNYLPTVKDPIFSLPLSEKAGSLLNTIKIYGGYLQM